ncbi:FecR family protein [Paenibacillus dendritiformis]|uniref:FecR family protein n=1 Tax=Paenibacillus dendritiformis TaxID=130049 RepID=UPI001BCE6B5A|nr:FecR family protein [Paenibacillus dendritiformis]
MQRRRWNLMCIIACCLLVAGLIRPVPAAAADKAVRVALVKEWKGTATVTKSGGGKPLQLFKNMSINQGDRIVTGSKSRVVLQLVGGDEEDELTIGEEADVAFTELDGEKGAKTKIAVWAGSVFAKVKSIMGVDDRFELETPTTVMAVRGTQFAVHVDPGAGWTDLHVTSGVVRTQYLGIATDSAARGTSLKPVLERDVYPSQAASFIPSKSGGVEALFAYADTDSLAAELDPAVLRAMVRGFRDAAEENSRLLRAWREAACSAESSPADGKSCRVLESFLQLGGDKEGSGASAGARSEEEIRIQRNLAAFHGVIVRAALEAGRLTAAEAAASGTAWRDAALQLTAGERERITRMKEKRSRLEEAFSAAEPPLSKEEEARRQQQAKLDRERQLQLERDYAASLGTKDRERFAEDLRKARLEVCENGKESALCVEAPKPGLATDETSGSSAGNGGMPNPDPGPGPKPDPDPDPDPELKKDVLELTASPAEVQPGGAVEITAVLKRLTQPVDVAAIQFAVQATGGTLDRNKLDQNAGQYRHGGGKFDIALSPDEYKEKNSVDAVSVTGSRVLYRILVTTPGSVRLDSEDAMLTLPYLAGSGGTMSFMISDIRFYDAAGTAHSIAPMEKPLEIKVNP